MPPLISVMMPCFNGERTLPRALASLVAQTYSDWECVFVDDGSTDRSAELAEMLDDPRIRVVRLGRNLGRGAARQAALDACNGELLCLLDADDWIYPTRLERQVEAMASHPRLALVSTGLAIVDSRGELAGIRAVGPEGPLTAIEPARGLKIPQVAFAPSMIRTELARSAGFRLDLPACEDLAFLIELLRERSYAILPEISYVYTEHESNTLDKLVVSARMCRRVFRSYRARHPIASRLRELESLVKETAYRAGFAMRLEDHLIRRRSLRPTEREIEAYRAARHAIDAATAQLVSRMEARAGRDQDDPGGRSARPGELGKFDPGEKPMLHSASDAQGEGKRARPVLVHITTVPETLDFVAGHVAAMRSRGYEVHAIAAPGARLDAFGERMGIPCHGIPMTRRIDPAGDLMALLRLWRLLRRLRPAIVHAHSPKGGLLGMLAARAAGVPGRVYSLLGLPLATATGWRRQALLWSDRIACALASRRLSVSPSLREAIARARICRADRIDVLANGSPGGVEARGHLNPAVVGQAVRRAERRRLGIPESARVIGFVGRVARDKGIVELIEAWRLLRRDDPDLHLLIVGPMEPNDPIPVDTTEKIVTDDRVHLAGPVADPAPSYAAIDVVALPTYREGFGQVLIEAAAMRLPVVASRVVGCVDSVVDGVTGMLVPAGDAPALAAALWTYLIDPDLRQRHGEAARARALRDFEPETIFEATAALYASLLRTAHGGSTWTRAIKRSMDVVLSVAGLIMLAPVMAAVAIAVGRKMGRPVLFRQVRPGKDGRTFVLYKFRTMREANGPDGEALPDADRLTAIGNVLRRTSLDELPQLWNVLRGDMSLVGPRPLLVEYLPHYDKRQRTRHDVRPGITGLAQVHGRNELPWDLRLELDARYVEQVSVRLDLAILASTVMKVVRGSGVALDTIRFDDFARRGARTGGRA